MSQQIKITESELAEIRMLQNKFQDCLWKLGNLSAERIELDHLLDEFDKKEKQAKAEWESLQKLEQGVLDKIAKNYGDGNLNIMDGIFIPTIKDSKTS